MKKTDSKLIMRKNTGEKLDKNFSRPCNAQDITWGGEGYLCLNCGSSAKHSWQIKHKPQTNSNIDFNLPSHSEFDWKSFGLSKPLPSDYREGYGYVYDRDMVKDPKHIKGERWRIKFQSVKDLGKNTKNEKSDKITEHETQNNKQYDSDEDESYEINCPICRGEGVELGNLGKQKHFRCKNCGINFNREIDENINMTKNKIKIFELKQVIKNLINEMWIGWEESNHSPKSFNRNNSKICQCKESDYKQQDSLNVKEDMWNTTNSKLKQYSSLSE
jgi:hypothetical protein